MLTQILGRLEALQSDLATIDPDRDADAADRVAGVATSLRDVLAGVGLPALAEIADDRAALATGL